MVILEQRQYKNDSTKSRCMLILKMPYFRYFEKGQFSDKNVICVEMSIRIAKIPKIPRVSIYMATFELKLVESL